MISTAIRPPAPSSSSNQRTSHMRPASSTIPTRHSANRNVLIAAVAVCALATMMKSDPAFAIDKIYSPNATEGELEVEYAGSTTFDNHHDKNDLQSHETELEYGLTDRIMLELSGSFEKMPDESIRSTKIGFGGRYQFFEQGENWMDTGLLVSYGHATQNMQPDSVEVKLLLEKQWG